MVSPSGGEHRGRYDRMLSEAERGALQHDRIMQALETLLADPLTTVGVMSLSVSRIVAEAHVGRNTFYEHFSSLHHALVRFEWMTSQAYASSLERAVTRTMTPRAQLRQYAETWFKDLATDPIRGKASLVLAGVPSDPKWEGGLRAWVPGAPSIYGEERIALGSALHRVLRPILDHAYCDKLINQPPFRLGVMGAVGAALSLGQGYLQRGVTLDRVSRVWVNMVMGAFS